MAFERAILPLLWARTPEDVRCIGTLFIIARAGHQALAFTARHSIEYVRRESGVDNLSELRVSPAFRKSLGLSVAEDPSLIVRPVAREGMLVSAIPGGPSIEVTGCDHLSHEDVDVALLTLRIDPSEGVRFDVQTALQTRGPRIGDRVRLLGFNHQSDSTVEMLPESGTHVQFRLNFHWVDAEVTSLHRWGEDRLVRSPCFRVNRAVDSGFSGGPALLLADEGEEAPACGMISASDSDETAASLLYPLLAIRNPIPGPPGHDNPKSLLGLCAQESIIDRSEAHRRLKFRRENPYGDPNDFAVWYDDPSN
jgi:hypothetical protein